MLRATTACTFSTSQLPKVVREWCVLHILLRATTACNFSSLLWQAGSAPAALASLLFDPPEPQIIGKRQCFAAFLTFRASVSSVFLTYALQDLFSVQLWGELKSFISNWDQVLAGIVQTLMKVYWRRSSPDESVLETLFCKQVKNCKAIQYDMNEHHRADEGTENQTTISLFLPCDTTLTVRGWKQIVFSVQRLHGFRQVVYRTV